MGYDMHMVEPPEKPIKGYFPQTEDLPELFLLSNNAMWDMIDAMSAAGVMDGSEELKALPDWPPKGISQKRVDALGAEHCLAGSESHIVYSYPNEPTPREEKAFDQWALAAGSLLAGRSANPRKVPSYKFTSHVGWFVSPEECRLIAQALKEGLASTPQALLAPYIGSGWTEEATTKWILSWATYNEVAASHGGYRVK